MNSNLIKQINQLQQNISELQKQLESMNDLIVCNNDVKCDTLTSNNVTVNKLSQVLGNLNVFGDLHLENTKFYLNNNCHLYMKDNKLCFNNGEKDMLVALTEMN
jgi:hypothetical protein